jgi:putative transposase
MMTAKRKQYTATFKAQVALAALKGDKTINELAAQFGVHPTLIQDWKKHLLTTAEQVFANGVRRPIPPPRPKPRRPNCSSRSDASKWSWSGSKKKSALSVEQRRRLDRLGPPPPERPPPVPTAGAFSVEPVLRTGQRDRGELAV